MKYAIQYSLSENLLVDSLVNTINTIQKEFEKFNSTLNKNIQILEQIDNTAFPHNFEIKSLNTSVFNSLNNINDTGVSNPTNSVADVLTTKSGNSGTYLQDNISNQSINPLETKMGLNLFEEIPKLAENSLKLSETFGELPPILKRFKNGLSIINNINDGTKGIAGLLSAENGITATESIASASEIMGGATGIAEAGSAFGPPGWIGAAAVLIGGAIISAHTKEKKREKKYAAEQLQTQSSIETFTMSETEASSYLKSIDKYGELRLHKWQLSVKPVKENIKKYGRNTYDLNIPIPVAKADSLKTAPVLTPGISVNNEDIIPVKQSYLEQTFDLQQRLKYAGMTKGRSGFDELAFKAIRDAENYDKIYHSHTLSRTESAIKEGLSFLLHSANDNRVISGTNSNAAKKGNNYKHYATQSNSNKIININLNKPLIENFTINTKDTKEGVNDFKRKVEEVLLEILNNSNMIQ